MGLEVIFPLYHPYYRTNRTISRSSRLRPLSPLLFSTIQIIHYPFPKIHCRRTPQVQLVEGVASQHSSAASAFHKLTRVHRSSCTLSLDSINCSLSDIGYPSRSGSLQVRSQCSGSFVCDEETGAECDRPDHPLTPSSLSIQSMGLSPNALRIYYDFPI